MKKSVQHRHPDTGKKSGVPCGEAVRMKWVVWHSFALLFLHVSAGYSRPGEAGGPGFRSVKQIKTVLEQSYFEKVKQDLPFIDLARDIFTKYARVEILPSDAADFDAIFRVQSSGAVQPNLDIRNLSGTVSLEIPDGDTLKLDFTPTGTRYFAYKEFFMASTFPDRLMQLVGTAFGTRCVISATKDENERIKAKAIQTLGNLANPVAVEPLIKIMRRSRSESMRLLAVEALGKIGDARAVQPITEYMLNRCDGTGAAEVVVRALGEIGDPGSIGPIKSFSERWNNENLNRVADEALKKIGESGREPRATVVVGTEGKMRVLEPLYYFNFKSGTHTAIGTSALTKSGTYFHWGLLASFDLNWYVGLQINHQWPILWPLEGGWGGDASASTVHAFKPIMQKPDLEIYHSFLSYGINLYLSKNAFMENRGKTMQVPLYFGFTKVNVKISEESTKSAGYQICSQGNCNTVYETDKNTLATTHSDGIYFGAGYQIIKERDYHRYTNRCFRSCTTK